MDPTTVIDNSAVSLLNTATLFGQGAIASAISGNPFYSQDPAAANYATQTGIAPVSATSSSTTMLLVVGLLAYFLLKG